MNPFNRLKKAVQNPGQLLQNYLKDYIAVDPPSKAIILKPKAVLLLCQQAVFKVEKLTSLEPDPNEGLIAVIEHEAIKVNVHFSPEKILLTDDGVEGQLRLLSKPQIDSDRIIYRTLIAGWKIFLGGNLSDRALPEGVRIDGEMVYYRFPNGQLRILDMLLQNLENNSALNLTLQEGELRIESAVEIHWNQINLQGLLQIFKSE
jgi:hypothetical protein